MRFLETIFGKKNALREGLRFLAFFFREGLRFLAFFFPKMVSRDLHGTLYLWLIDVLFPLVFGLRIPLDFFEVKKLKLGGPFLVRQYK